MKETNRQRLKRLGITDDDEIVDKALAEELNAAPWPEST